MNAYARLVVALRYPIILAWIAGAVAATAYLPDLSGEQGAPLEGLVADDSPAVRTELRSAELFDVPVLTRTVVVRRDPEGLAPGAEQRALGGALAVSQGRDPDLQRVRFALPVVNTLGVVPSSRERGTTVVTFLFFSPAMFLAHQDELAHRYAERYAAGPEAGFVGVTGAIPARLDQFDAIQAALPRVEQVTVLVIALILALTFRAPGAALVPLLSAGLGYLVAVRALAAVGDAIGVNVPRELEPLVLVLMLGIVTDYAIFFLASFRRRLEEGAPRLDAARETTISIVPIVLTAGLIVTFGTAALLAGTLDFFRAFGPGMALAAFVGVLLAVTFVPAALAVFGRAVFWPSLRRRDPEAAREEERTRRPPRIARMTASRGGALAVALLCVAALLAGATGLRDLRLGFTLITGLPQDAEAHRAAREASEGFAPGLLAPTTVLVEAPGIASRLEAIRRFDRALERQSGVVASIGPTDAPRALAGNALVAPSGDAVRYLLVFDHDPGGGPAIESLERIRDSMPLLQEASGLSEARVGLAGDTALAADTVGRIVDDLARIAVAALLANLFFLVVFLRALVAPLFLLAASVLALAASLGLATYVFQGLLGHGELTYYVPFAAAVLLVSLGSDYNIFVAGRVWAEARRRPLREAVAVAAPRASRAIAIASIALAASFAVLALVPLRPFREFAFIMGAGVLVDSFVVRSLLVPALISLVGDASAWPGRFTLPRTVEPDARDAG